jgi:hypothetical protein
MAMSLLIWLEILVPMFFAWYALFSTFSGCDMNTFLDSFVGWQRLSHTCMVKALSTAVLGGLVKSH